MKTPLAIGAVLAMLIGVTGAQAAGGFDRHDLEGTWAFSAHGVVGTPVVVGPGTIPVGTAVVTAGLITFDRGGTCVSRATTKVDSFPAFPPGPSASCTFTVNPDGTGTIEVFNTGSPFSPVELSFVLSSKNQGFVITTDELVLSGELKRQKDGDRH